MGNLAKAIGYLIAAVLGLVCAVLLFLPAVILLGAMLLGLAVLAAIGYILVQTFIAVFL